MFSEESPVSFISGLGEGIGEREYPLGGNAAVGQPIRYRWRGYAYSLRRGACAPQSVYDIANRTEDFVIVAGHDKEDSSSDVNASIITTPQWSRARKLAISQGMPREVPPPDRNIAVAERLILAREAIGIKQGKFATMAELSPNGYNQWETGANYPEVTYAIKLCDRHGLTLDWIYRGKFDGMPTWLSDAIRALQTAREHQPKRPRFRVVQSPRRKA